jgi:cell division protein FtsB
MGRWNWGQIVTPAFYILLIAILAVFGHSGLQGEHGLAALHQAEARERQLTAELAEIREQHHALLNLVRRLGERARAVLGYVRRDELIIR